MESDEAPWEALVRAVREETGLHAAVGRLVGVYAKRDESDLVFVFAATAKGGELRSSDERDRVEFVDPEDLPAETSDRDRERIADAVSQRGEALFVIQPSQGQEPQSGTR